MGEIDILRKLSEKFESAPRSEEDVVFILSRIRKIIEKENYPEKYSILNFYCNLALHIKIDKRVPKKLADELLRVHTNLEYSHPFFGYLDLHNQMEKFIKEHNLPDFYEHPDFKGSEFIKLLNSVYCDTPVIVKIVKEYQVVVNRDGTITGKFSDPDPSTSATRSEMR